MMDLAPLPMSDAVKFWGDKVQLSPGQYAALADQARTMAFAVAGIAKGDELATVHEALMRSLAEGTTFVDFKKDAARVFERRGFGSHRVETIYRTNIQTAYNVGRYAEMKREKGRPYWEYSAVNDSRTRPTHAALNGKIFPADHPFWDSWYPPNGFRCRCGVTSISEEEARAEGLTVETFDPTGTLIEPVDYKTGQRLQARPLVPDAGFDGNPGKDVFGIFVDSKKQGKFDALPGLKGPSDYRRPGLANIRPAELKDFPAAKLLPAKRPDSFYIEEFRRLYGEKDKPVFDPKGEQVLISLRSFLVSKAKGQKPRWKFKKAGHGEAIPLLEEMITAPLEIWLTPQINANGRVRLAKRYVCAWKTPGKERVGGIAVFECVDGAFQGVTEFLPRFGDGTPDIGYADEQRKGLLLYLRR